MKILFAWSGGKDSALALHQILLEKQYNIAALVVNADKESDTVCHHAVGLPFVRQQAVSLGLPLEIVYVGSAENYELEMKNLLEKYRKKGVQAVGFGDIYLEDLRKYREERLAEVGMCGLFPLWKKDTMKLACRSIELGFKAVVTSVDFRHFKEQHIGLGFDYDFLTNLPEGVDSCGEKGEFHTFVYEGPIFRENIAVEIGRKYSRAGYFYGELMTRHHPPDWSHRGREHVLPH